MSSQKEYGFMCLPSFSRDQLMSKDTTQLYLFINDLDKLKALIEAELTLRGEF